MAPAVPVIVVSANAEVDDKVLLLELGADNYVTKPFGPRELVATVRQGDAPHHARTVLRHRQVPRDESHLYRFADVTGDVESNGGSTWHAAH